MKCEALIVTCRNCERRFRRDERMETCPDCGEDRHCTHDVVEGYKYCTNHGAPSPKRDFYGVGRGLTTGAGSSFQITRLAAKYNQMQADGRLLSNRASLEIVRHRITQLAERIDLNEAPDRMARIAEMWREYRKKRAARMDIEAELVAAEIDNEFEAAYTDFAAWKQMFEALDLDKRMVESEVKIMKDIQAIITAEDAYQLAAKLLGAVIHVVTDPAQLRQIQWEFARIVGEQPEQRSSGSSGQVIDSQ